MKRCKDINECESHCKAEDDWHVAGCGELLVKNWKCTKCGRSWREVYIFAGMIDNDTEEELKYKLREV